MTYRGILNNSWFTRPKPAPRPQVVRRPVPPPASEFEYHPADSEPLPVGKTAVREDWRERGYGE